MPASGDLMRLPGTAKMIPKHFSKTASRRRADRVRLALSSRCLDASGSYGGKGKFSSNPAFPFLMVPTALCLPSAGQLLSLLDRLSCPDSTLEAHHIVPKRYTANRTTRHPTL